MGPCSHRLLIAVVAVTAALPLRAADCNLNGELDAVDIERGAEDCNENGVPDECETETFSLRSAANYLDLDFGPDLIEADFDGDGSLDLAVRSIQSRRVTAYSLGPAGSVDTLFEYSFPDGVTSMSLASFDRDGVRNDLLVVAGFRPFILRTAPGASRDPEPIPLEGVARYATALDIDGDAIAEVVAALDSNLLLTTTEGEVLATLPTQQTAEVIAGDFDGDGDRDLAKSVLTVPVVTIFWNQSQGNSPLKFSRADSIRFRSPIHSIFASEIDGDDRDDLTVFFTDSASTLLSRGSSIESFETHTVQLAPISQPPRLVRLVNDGPPVWLTTSADDNSMRAIFTDTSGLAFEQSALLGFPVESFTTADFDDDGYLDVATLSTGGRLDLLSQRGSSSPSVVFSATTIASIGKPHAVASGDFDGDGDPDVVAGDGGRGTLAVFINDPPGTFSQVSADPTNSSIHTMTSGDFDRDGDLDVVLGGFERGRVTVWLNRGDAVFRSGQELLTEGSVAQVQSGDLNGDGALDLVFASRGFVYVVPNDGTGRFSVLSSYRAGASSAAIVDLDGNGRSDIVTTSGGTRELFIAYQIDDLVFDAPVRLPCGGSCTSIVAGDWNLDGVADLATSNASSSVSVFENLRDGNFSEPLVIPLPFAPHSITTGELTRDGRPDLLVTSELGSQALLLRSKGDGDFEAVNQYRTGAGPRFSTIADFNEDGLNDFVTINRGSTNITYFEAKSPDDDGRDYLETICTPLDFRSLAQAGFGESPRADRFDVKYIVPARGDPELLPTTFQHTRRFPLHHEFLSRVFPLRFPSLTAQSLVARTQRRATRDYFIGAVFEFTPEGGKAMRAFSVVASSSPDEVLQLEEVRGVYENLRAAFPLSELAYAPDPSGDQPLARAAAESWGAPGFPIFLGAALGNLDFAAYTTGVGFGRVRLLNKEKFDAANEEGRWTFQDLIVTDHAPRDIEGVTAGVVTAAPQGPLSHLAVRTGRRGTPNAFVEQALLALDAYDGKLVRFEVTRGGYDIREAPLEEAEEFWSNRPSLPDPRPFDPDYRELRSISEMDIDSESLSARFGGKASGFARLQSVLTGDFARYREPGFALPVAHYLDFLRDTRVPSARTGNLVSLDTYLDELLTWDEFRSTSTRRFAELERLRTLARAFGRVPTELIDELSLRIESEFGSSDVPVRARSSSNVEDLLEFNGAGLYDSTSACVLDEGDADDEGPS
ncbi:MAG: FG-GAP-like repeat-containing protein, partial [Planctomycetota bacterium]